MATIKPFKAIRPAVGLAEKVAALPYDVMSRPEAERMVEGNPFSFLRVDRAEIELSPSLSPYHPQVYRRAGDNLRGLIENGALVKDEKEHMYIYQLEAAGKRQTGLVACASIQDYFQGIIKKHEHTRQEKEEDRVNHVLSCGANTGPILLFYREDRDVQEIMEDWIHNNNPVCHFTAEDGVAHRVWVIDDGSLIAKLVKIFSRVESLYIADGHHRCAAAARVGLMKGQRGSTGVEEFNFFLGVMFPHSQLHILGYNRAVRDLNGFSAKEFMGKIEDGFSVRHWKGEGPYMPKREHCFGMFMDGGWFELEALSGTWRDDDPVERLDVSILQNNLLGPVLGITDPRRDDRIEFVGGIRGLEELESMVRGDMAVAFSLYPTSIEALMHVADAGRVMPPKSTWFEPKLRSGLFIHSIK